MPPAGPTPAEPASGGTPRLPNFLIVGAAKSGTTSLASHLAAHPEVFVPAVKELYFFEREGLWAQGPEWYAQRFADAGTASAVGEATPSYMFYPWAVERIGALLPDVRTIVCLRDPVDRAYSHYLHWCDGMGFEPRSFRRAIEDELASGADEVAMHRHDTDPPYFGYLARGLYLPQLERLEAALGRERMHVILLEDLRSDPTGTFAATCRFLGVDDRVEIPTVGSRENAYKPHTPRRVWRLLARGRVLHRVPRPVARFVARRILVARERPVPPMPGQVRERLGEHFAPHNAALARWLGRDLSGWTGTSSGAHAQDPAGR